MINNCRSVVRPFVIALLLAGAGQAYAQLSRGQESKGLRDQPDACAEAGLDSKPAVCRAASEPASSKYNLLYADDAPADEGEDESPSHRHAGHARDDAYRGVPRNAATGS